MEAEKFPLWSGDELIRRTRAAFGINAEEPCTLEPIVKGGSVRTFHRAAWAGGSRTAIIMHYSVEKPENLLYAGHTQFLKRQGVRVPAILTQDKPAQLIWLEDIGRNDLLLLARTAEQPARLGAYNAVLMELSRLQDIRWREMPAGALPPMLDGFDTATYQWEQDYFFEHCMGGYFRLSEPRLAELRGLPALLQMAENLGQRQPVLVHRDFQSTNIIMRDGLTPVFIDFQGMRPGRAGYDVASLLYDPYTNLAKVERELLLSAYLEVRPAHLQPLSRTDYLHCAAQRLMQALGAYGNLGLNRGHPHFLKYIPVALPLLREVISELENPGLAPLAQALEECAAVTDSRVPATAAA